MAVLYRGIVRQVRSDGCMVQIPTVAPNYVFGPMKTSQFEFAVGDDVVVGQIGNYAEDFVLLGPLIDQFVAPTPVEKLDDLTDVVIATPSSSQLIQYDGVRWVNKSTLDLVAAAIGTDSLTVKVTGDLQSRLIVNGDGKLEWGGGSSTVDTNLYRNAADVLKTDDAFQAASVLASAAISGNTLVSTTSVTAATVQTTGNINSSAGDVGGTTVTATGVVTGGSASLSGQLTVQRTNATDVAYRSRITGDTQYRLVMNADGKMLFGAGGSSAFDTTLYRGAADTLTTDDKFSAALGIDVAGGAVASTRATATDSAITTKVTGDTQQRLIIPADGKLTWGSGSLAGDTNLYRSAADTLKTDDAFQVVGQTTLVNLAFTGTWAPAYRFMKTADQNHSTNNATFLSDTHMTAAVAANKSYRFFLMMIFMAPATNDFKMQVIGPASAVLDKWYWQGKGGSGTYASGIPASNGVNTLFGDGNKQTFWAEGYIHIAGTAGSVTIQWSKQNAENSTATVYTGSFMELELVN